MVECLPSLHKALSSVYCSGEKKSDLPKTLSHASLSCLHAPVVATKPWSTLNLQGPGPTHLTVSSLEPIFSWVLHMLFPSCDFPISQMWLLLIGSAVPVPPQLCLLPLFSSATMMLITLRLFRMFLIQQLSLPL